MLAPVALFAFTFQTPAPHTQFAPYPVPKYVCQSDILLMGEGGGDHHGWSLASGGNWHDTVSGTPGSDLLVGTFHKLEAPEFFEQPPIFLDSFHQYVSLYLSPFDWSDPCPSWHYRIRIRGEREGDRFGFSVAFIGDVDGDGFDDFAAGAIRGPKNALPPPENPWEEHGKVFVFLSGDEGIPFRPSQLCLDAPPCSNLAGTYPAASASLILKGERAGDRLGYSLAGIGDWNGDGKPNFVVGAPGGWRSDPAYPGTAYVVSGQRVLDLFNAQSSGGPQEVSVLSALDGSAPSVFTGDNPRRDRFGHSVARVGEAGGDANDSDFVVGAPEYLRDWDEVAEAILESESGPGYAKVFLGPATAPVVVTGEDDKSRFGFSVGGEIDLDDDPEGHDDVLIGAPLWDLEDGGQTLQHDVGRVYALNVGEGTYLHPEPLIGAYAGEQFGQYVKGLGNVVGGVADQTEDFVVGAWKTTVPTATSSVCTCPTNPDVGGRIAGRALVFNGLGLSQELEYWGEYPKDSAGTPTVLLEGAGPAGADVLAISGLRWGYSVSGVPEQGRVYLFRLFP